MWFEPFYKMDRKKSLDSSNLIVKATSETCKGCGLCSKRCPMEALTMKPHPAADPKLNRKAQVPELTAKHSIGCGVCVVKCPIQSLILEPRPAISNPPATILEWVKDHWKARER